jgi:hypothetical protein
MSPVLDICYLCYLTKHTLTCYLWACTDTQCEWERECVCVCDSKCSITRNTKHVTYGRALTHCWNLLYHFAISHVGAWHQHTHTCIHIYTCTNTYIHTYITKRDAFIMIFCDIVLVTRTISPPTVWHTMLNTCIHAQSAYSQALPWKCMCGFHIHTDCCFSHLNDTVTSSC